jgi:hypothetical protein
LARQVATRRGSALGRAPDQMQSSKQGTGTQRRLEPRMRLRLRIRLRKTRSPGLAANLHWPLGPAPAPVRGPPGERGVRGPDFFLRKPLDTYLRALKPGCGPPGPIGNTPASNKGRTGALCSKSSGWGAAAAGAGAAGIWVWDATLFTTALDRHGGVRCAVVCCAAASLI